MEERRARHATLLCWSALTLRTVARAANVTPQAIAAWFPSVGSMRLAVSMRYGERWIQERTRRSHHRMLLAHRSDEERTVQAVVAALLPQTWLEAAYDGVWLSIVEAGRWDEEVRAGVAQIQEQERELVRDLLDPYGQRTDEQVLPALDLVVTLVRGLRATHLAALDGVDGPDRRTATVLAALDLTGIGVRRG